MKKLIPLILLGISSTVQAAPTTPPSLLAARLTLDYQYGDSKGYRLYHYLTDTKLRSAITCGDSTDISLGGVDIQVFGNDTTLITYITRSNLLARYATRTKDCTVVTITDQELPQPTPSNDQK